MYETYRHILCSCSNTIYYVPAMTMAGTLSVTPVRTYVRTSVKRRPLSKSNTFDQNFMKLGRIV